MHSGCLQWSGVAFSWFRLWHTQPSLQNSWTHSGPTGPPWTGISLDMPWLKESDGKKRPFYPLHWQPSFCLDFVTCSDSIADRAVETLSVVRCVLLRPWWNAAPSICISLSWIFERPGALCAEPWPWPKPPTTLWLAPDWLVGNLEQSGNKSQPFIS